MVRLLPYHDSSLDQTPIGAWILCDSLPVPVSYELWTILEDVLPKSRPTVFSSACAMTSPHGSFLVLQKIVPTTTSDYLLKVTSSCCRSFMLHNVICISPSMFVNAYSSQEQQQALRFTVIILMTAF